MKIAILYPFKAGPWGGGNQFLKALRNELRTTGHYTDKIEDADVVLFNSFENGANVLDAKKRCPGAIFIHRVDGPIAQVRGKDRALDMQTFALNATLADGTIFQSAWCREQCIAAGLQETKFSTTIYNAPDPNIFFPRTHAPLQHNRRTRLIATSWSTNIRKGFDYYAALDETLDFSQYDMTFIGNTPFTFTNIVHKPAMDSAQLAKELRAHDIYITASQTEPCSNSLIEALACGLPAVARNSGGHPELIGSGGVLFKTVEEMYAAIDTVRDHYTWYTKNLPIYKIQNTARAYVTFAKEMCEAVDRGTLTPKQVTLYAVSRYHAVSGLALLSRIVHKFRDIVHL